MAREYAAILCSIWGDPDWRQLTGEAQHLYLQLLTQGSLSFCGVTDYYPKRLAVVNINWTTDTVNEAASLLVERGYIVIDEDTDEVWIRSFVRHDGLLKKPNVAVAMAKNYQGIVSLRIRRAFVRELLRLREDERFADLTAWGTAKVAELLREPSEEPAGEPKAIGIPNPFGGGSPMVSADEPNQCLTSASASATATTPSNQQASVAVATAAPKPVRPEFEEVCAHLADAIEANGSKRPTITQKWLDAARLMIDTDGRTPDEIHGAINYSQRDEFWRANILSMPKLREKYDQLRLQAQRSGAPARPGSGPPVSTTDMRMAAVQALKADLRPDQRSIGA